MRSFIISILILSTVIAAIICNSLYVTDKAAELLAICDTLKSGSAPDAQNKLLDTWESCRDILALSIHGSEIDRAETAILSVCAYSDDSENFAAQLSILTGKLEHISSSQRFSLDNIF